VNDSVSNNSSEWLEKRYDLIHQRDIFTMFSSTYLDKCLTSGRGSVLAGIPKTSEWKVWTDPSRSTSCSGIDLR
jgi:hypothetical protein